MVPPSSTSSSDSAGHSAGSNATRSLRPYAWALAIVLAIDVACRFLAPRGSLELEFQKIRQRVEQEAPPPVQIIGDSVAAGAVMEDIASTQALRVRNDAIMGTSPTFTYFLVREQLKRGHRPKALIFSHHPRLFAVGAPTSFMGLFAHWWELPHILTSNHGLDRENVGFSLLTRVSYLLAYRAQLRELITGETPTFVVEGAGVPQRQRLKEYVDAIAANRFAPKPLEPSVSAVYRVPFEPTTDNDEFFRKLVALADENDIELYWLSIPVSERVALERRKLHYDQQLQEYLRPFVEAGTLRYLNQSSSVYADDEFDDFAHLNMRGAVHFSCELRALLEQNNLSKQLLGDSAMPVGEQAREAADDFSHLCASAPAPSMAAI